MSYPNVDFKPVSGVSSPVRNVLLRLVLVTFLAACAPDSSLAAGGSGGGAGGGGGFTELGELNRPPIITPYLCISLFLLV
jgi:hypothetical protein